MMTTKFVSVEEGNRRLLVLAAFLDELPPERFDYTKWVGRDWGGAEDLSCGTVACALGWATTIPEFRELGLRLKLGANGSSGAVTLGDSEYASYGTSIAAAQELFCLTSLQVNLLFVPSGRALYEKSTPKQVADLIRSFANERWAYEDED